MAVIGHVLKGQNGHHFGHDIKTLGKEASKPSRVALGFSLLPNTLHCNFVKPGF